MKICVYGASSNDIADVYFENSEKLGKELAKRGYGLVFGGGKRGLMGAAARGAFSENGEIIGIAPEFFDVDGTLFAGCTQIILTKTMRERKEKMEMLSDAFIMMPGGIGTFDEFFEILTLRQLGQHAKPIGILNTNGYYDNMLSMLRKIADDGFMLKSGFEMFDVCDDPCKLMDTLEQRLKEKQEPRLFKKISD